jgi:zinc protease
VYAVRVKQGLSYHAGCYWDQRAAAGAFVATSFTKQETAKELAEVVLREIETFQQKGPTSSELAAAHQYLCGCFPMAIQTNDAFLAALADMEFYDLPSSWIERYRDNVLAVDMKQARKAARDYLPLDNRLLVFSGDANALAPRLKRLGPIQTLELSELS